MSSERTQPSRTDLVLAHATWMTLLAVGTLTAAAIPGFIGWCGTARTGCRSEAEVAAGILQAVTSMGVGAALVAVVFVVLPWARLKVRLLVTAGLVALVALAVAAWLSWTR
ncbi:hypothetical protein [Frigoribacterium faeni]|uniref:hypothetical protein n=1 Tax=Frigoribacterium faeni TaxID=145483 RepID=UPI00141AEC0B|nr:hypothetical protein [Frigoribacterium faeni]NIJ06364.1 hypothetical protein [Frigoribacterium faeni]